MLCFIIDDVLCVITLDLHFGFRVAYCLFAGWFVDGFWCFWFGLGIIALFVWFVVDWILLL